VWEADFNLENATMSFYTRWWLIREWNNCRVL